MKYIILFTLLFFSNVLHAQSSFSPPKYTPIESVDNSSTINSSDFNNDGKVDIAYFDPSDSCFKIYLGIGDGHFSFFDSTNVISFHGLGSSCFGNQPAFLNDFNNDGFTDIVLRVDSFSQRSIRVFLNNGNGSFNSATVIYGNLSQWFSIISTKDVNNDGFKDIVYSDVLPLSMNFYAGNGAGSFSTTPSQINIPSPSPSYIGNNFCDLNNDGYIDAVTFTSSGNYNIYNGSISNNFSLDTTLSFPNPVYLYVEDLNNDSYKDIFIKEVNDSTHYILINDSLGNFTKNQFSWKIPISSTVSLNSDFNGDSKNDLAWVYSNSIKIAQGDGTGQFILPTTFNIGHAQHIYDDFNGDGKTDIAGLITTFPNKGIVCTINQINSLIFYSPHASGNCGYTKIIFQGASIFPKMHLKFTATGLGNIEVPDSNITYTENHTIQVKIDFSSATIGKYNVVLTDSNGMVTTILDGFEIQPTTPSNLEIKIIGPSIARANRKTRYYLKITNTGNCIALAVPILFFISGTNIVTLPQTIYDFSGNQLASPTFSDPTNYFTNEALSKGINLLLNQIEANKSEYLPVDIEPITSGEIHASIGKPLIDNNNPSLSPDSSGNIPFEDKIIDCISIAFVESIESSLGTAVKPKEGCNDKVEKINDDFIFGDKSFITADFGFTATQAIGNCGAYYAITKPGGVIAAAWLKAIAVGAGLLEGLYNGSQECFCILGDPMCNQDKLDIETITSFDPNDKYGSGHGVAHWINNIQELSYGIHFENVDTASASAQVVILRDTLDMSKVDIATFKPELITISNHPVDLSTYKTNQPLLYDMRPATNLIVKMEIMLDSLSGEIKVIYTSLDPFTMQLTTNPLLGFLPPNINKPDGEGSFYYSVKLKAGLPNNTVIKNTANIYFDNNDPILTPTWINTLDILPPTSKMNTNVPNTNDTTIYLSWKGNDAQSGVQKYDIFYSENGSVFIPYLTNIANDSIRFNGKAGSSYSFYTIAIDNVGNREVKSNGEVSTAINEQEIQIFPNPSNGEFTVQVRNDLEVTKLVLFDLQGNKIPITYKKINNTLKVQLPSQQNIGNYILKIITIDKSISRKITIEK